MKLRAFVFHVSTDKGRGEGIKTFQRPEGVKSGEMIFALERHFGKSWNDGLVAFDNEHPLGGIAPPAVGMFEVLHELRRGFIQHVWLWAGFEILVRETQDAAFADVVLKAIFFNLATQEAAFLDPVAFLDDPAIHVHDVDGAIRPSGHVHGAEVRVGAADELRLTVRIGHGGDTIFDLNRSTADETTYGLWQEDVTIHFLWKSITTEDGLAAGSGEVIQRLVFRAEATGAALHIGETNKRPYGVKISWLLACHVDRCVKDVSLVVPDALFTTGIGPPHLTVVVLGEAPLATIAGGRFFERSFLAIPAEAVAVVGGIDPVIQTPNQTTRLVF